MKSLCKPATYLAVLGAILALLISAPIESATASPPYPPLSLNGGRGCAVLANGHISCWQVQHSAMGDVNGLGTPFEIPGIDNAVDISSGKSFTCALLSDGTVKCWGSLVDGNHTADNPAIMAGISNAVSISVGDFHGCAVLATEQLKCWGWNYSGALGDGTTNNTAVPVLVPDLAHIRSVSAGGQKTCAVNRDGAVYCWGFGALTEARPTGPFYVSSNTPVATKITTGAVKVAAGHELSCAIMNTATLNCFPFAIYSTWTPDPTEIPNLNGVIDVAMVWTYSPPTAYVLTDDGLITHYDTRFETTAVKQFGMEGMARMAVADAAVCGLTFYGSVKCNGYSLDPINGTAGTPKPPTNIRENERLAGKLSITWDDPETWGLPIDKYGVLTRSGPNSWTEHETTTPSFVWTAIDIWSRETLSVRAHTAAGWGQYEQFSAQPPVPPILSGSVPVSFLSTTSVTILCPTTFTSELPIDKYRIELVNNADASDVVSVESNTCNFNVTGLRPFSGYRGTYYMHNAAGWSGSGHNADAFTTPPAVPVHGLQAVSITSNTARISWDAVTDAGLPVDSYSVMVFTEGSQQVVYSGTVTGTSVLLADLTPSRRYTVHVAALASLHTVGSGSTLFTTAVSTEPQSPVRQLSYKFSATRAKVSWLPSAPHGPQVLAFEARIRPRSGTTWGKWIPLGRNPSVTFSGLKKQTTYLVQIRAFVGLKWVQSPAYVFKQMK